MVPVMSCRSAMLLACAVQHRTVGSLGTVMATYERAVDRRYTHAPHDTELSGHLVL
jgi:hypothetical protein